MNELCNTTGAAAKIRKTLLATASAVVLAAYSENVQAFDAERPTVWIEGGSQFESIVGENDPFVPPLDAYTRAIGFTSLTTLEKALGRTYGGQGSISFQPKDSDWVFTASARYGRVQTTQRRIEKKNVVGPQMQKFVIPTENGGHGNLPFTPSYEAYGIGYSKNSEAHAIVDFQVGKDIGIGLFGRGTDSIISSGIRYAQMNAQSKGHSYGVPDIYFEQFESDGFFGHKYQIRTHFQRSFAFVERTDSLHALGPSLSMKNSTGLLGTVDSGQLALDWGVNAALLFGRQKAKVSHHSTIRHTGTGANIVDVYEPVTVSRSRMVTVPNIGGFAGFSYRFPNAKLSAGYRADFFFDARDGGLETRKATDVGFHGPFATLSIGLGG
jgi:hypothetical protein